ncbi:MAG: RNA pseudouridine synthase [Sphingomonas sp.]|uniref:RluA family pseudouridine synthase n=1 Tax=Sphingomonas sp. TaxID=28214 RepID=UPI001B0716E0|nr:RNA pseudouridine synthase [Sphingomonas sp.]MBO9621138.1 RNA pseudouridine synthase [Sphingomonas sp.]
MLQDRILFIDGEAIVIDKPAGLPVDRPRDRSESLEDLLCELTFGFRRLPLPVHRLDRDTSGCLLLARNPKAHKRFAQAFEAGTVAKRYVAILDGVPEGEGGMIDLPLAKISSVEAGWRMVGDPKGKPARTRWELLQADKGRALVAFYPETGRTHQIRVHAAEGLGVPILGDPVYGKGGPAVMLHAAALTVAREGKPDVHAEAPLPVRFHNAGFGTEPEVERG